MTKSHIASGANSINIYLTIQGCRKAIEFYKKAFGASERYYLSLPDGTIAHAEIEIEGTLIMMAEENADWGTKSPLTLNGTPVCISLYVEDVEHTFQKSIDAGAIQLMPIKDEFYGDRVGQILDPFGYKWMIAKHIEDVSPEEMQIRMNKLFGNN